MFSRYAFTFLAILFSFAALAHSGATGIVKERMDAFKQSQTHLKAIIKAAKSGEFDKAQELAALLAEWGEKMPEYFPAGSTTPPSEASPLIWTEFDAFSEKADAFKKAAENVIAAASLADAKATLQAAKAVGSSCKSCHTRYRLDK